jgi:hypothetical protein
VLARVDDAVWNVQNRWPAIYIGFDWRVWQTEIAIHFDPVVQVTVSNPLYSLL